MADAHLTRSSRACGHSHDELHLLMSEADGWLLLAVLTQWLDAGDTLALSTKGAEEIVRVLTPLIAPEGSMHAALLAGMRASAAAERMVHDVS